MSQNAQTYFKDLAAFAARFSKICLNHFGKLYINPFVSNAPFPCVLKTSKNLKVFWCFQVVEQRCIGNKWLKELNIYFFPIQIKI